MPKDKRPVLTVPQYALLKRAAEFAGHAGTPGRVEPLAMQFLATVTVQHANPHGVLKSLRDDGWIRMDGNAYAFDPGDFPVRTEHLRGARPRSIPENGLCHAARHWKAGERNLSERHLIASPEGYVENTPPAAEGTTTRPKGSDRLVASSAPPENRAEKKRAVPTTAPASARPAPRISMTAEGIETILFRHALQEDEAGGPLTLHASGEIFRGQVSDTQGYAARMKLKEDGLYEPVHADESTVLWRVTAVGRARVAARLAAHCAPPPPTQTPATDQPAHEPTIVKEQKQMSGDNITHAPTTWPERPVEAGGTREVHPRKKLPGVELDDVDKAIIDAIIGRPDEKDLRARVMCVRRLSPGQVDGWRATRTKERGGSAPPAPKPAAPAAVSPPAPPPPAPPEPPSSAKSEIGISDTLFRAMGAVETFAAGVPEGAFTTSGVSDAIRAAGIASNPGQVVFRLKDLGLLDEIDGTQRGQARRYRVSGRPYRNNAAADAPVSEPATAPAPAPVAHVAPAVPAAPAVPTARHGTLISEERAELDALLEERAKLDRFEDRDRAKLDEIATRRRVRKAKRNGLDARIAELRAKGGII